MNGFASVAAAQNLARKLNEAGISDHRVLDAVAQTPRELFLDGALTHKAYENTALPTMFSSKVPI